MKSYIASDCDSREPQALNVPITLKDVPDIELREMIEELDGLPMTEAVSSDLRNSLAPYLIEAGLDPDELNINRKIIIHGIMMYQVIEKRRFELNDLSKGMEDVSLSTFLTHVPLLKQIVFPTDAERNILAASLLDVLTYENKDGNEDNERTAEYFVTYIKEIELRKDGCACLIDLVSFWTASNTVGYDRELLLVKFKADNKLPMSETCIKGLVLPSKHTTYEDFRKSMDTALNYGSKVFVFT